MSMLDSSFMAPVLPDIIVPEDMTLQEMCDMICEAISNLKLEATFTTSDAVPPPVVTVTNEMNMEDMCAKLDSIDHNLGVLIMLLSKPVTRTVTRENGYISSITERRI